MTINYNGKNLQDKLTMAWDKIDKTYLERLKINSKGWANDTWECNKGYKNLSKL